jgi:tRNA(Arg) A34 adenosine deaminase TadA
LPERASSPERAPSGSKVPTEDEKHLRRAIALARVARSAGDPPFGSLLVGPDGRVLREETNTTLTADDITAHPELKLARWAATELDSGLANQTTMYTSCEPCSMCAGAIERSGLGRVVFALSMAELETIKGEGSGHPRAAEVVIDGPWLVDEARSAVGRYYEEHG